MTAKKEQDGIDLVKLTKIKRQSGNAAVQTAITLMVGVVLLIGAVGAYQYIGQAKVSNDISEITDLKNATVRYGQVTGVFATTNVTKAILTSLKFFPEQRVTGAGTTTAAIVNQWGGTVSVGVGTTFSAGDSIAFTYPGVPKDACVDLGTKLDNVAGVININGTETKAAGGKSAVATVITNCNVAANTIIYTLMR